jgi:hypothetical protein
LSILKINRLILLKEVVAVYCDMKDMKRQCRENKMQFLTVPAGGACVDR